MGVDIEKIYDTTLKHFESANQHLIQKNYVLEHRADALSDVIPGFSADQLEFGSYNKENYAVLFVDMRNSTKRAETYGAEKTFLMMHVYLTALLEVVKYYNGKVIDIMGDGLMVFWGGEVARQEENMFKSIAVQNAGLCGIDMLKVREEVINPIISDKDLGSPISIGVGVTYDSVVVTKIGINDFFDVKAFGDCVNKASKYADDVVNQVKVSKKVKNEWPSGKNGKISFISSTDGSYILKRDR